MCPTPARPILLGPRGNGRSSPPTVYSGGGVGPVFTVRNGFTDPTQGKPLNDGVLGGISRTDYISTVKGRTKLSEPTGGSLDGPGVRTHWVSLTKPQPTRSDFGSGVRISSLHSVPESSVVQPTKKLLLFGTNFIVTFMTNWIG